MRALKRLIFAFGIAAVVASAQAAVFSGQQTLEVSTLKAGNLSEVYWYDFNSGNGAFLGAQLGSYAVQYPMPSGGVAWMGLYDYGQDRWVEGVYLFDQGL